MTAVLAVLAVWCLAAIGAATIHHHARPPLPRRTVDPDRRPGPIDHTYYALETAYHQPARPRKENPQ